MHKPKTGWRASLTKNMRSMLLKPPARVYRISNDTPANLWLFGRWPVHAGLLLGLLQNTQPQAARVPSGSKKTGAGTHTPPGWIGDTHCPGSCFSIFHSNRGSAGDTPRETSRAVTPAQTRRSERGDVSNPDRPPDRQTTVPRSRSFADVHGRSSPPAKTNTIFVVSPSTQLSYNIID